MLEVKLRAVEVDKQTLQEEKEVLTDANIILKATLQNLPKTI